MTKKIIFIDVDGTLVPFNNKVSLKVKEAIKQAQQNGHMIFICTGRSKCAVEVFEHLGFDGYICGAGSYIEVHKQVIYNEYLSDQEVSMIKDLFIRNHLSYNLEAFNATYQDMLMMKIINIGKIFFKKTMKTMIDKYCLKPLSLYTGEPVYKMSFIAFNKKSLKEPKSVLENDYHFLIQRKILWMYNGEIIKRGFDKGTAVIKVLNYLNRKQEETICFGDSKNDLEMFQTCAYAVMMNDGYEGLKAYASSICESVKDDGIYHELKRLHIINE